MHTLERIFCKFTKPFRLYLRLPQNMKKVANYKISKESSASTRICRDTLVCESTILRHY